jgi:hypothetical protein
MDAGMRKNPIDLTDFHVLALEMGEAKIALQEMIEDGLRPLIPAINRFYWALFPHRWPRRSIKKWKKR